jgi:hypothetical protein
MRKNKRQANIAVKLAAGGALAQNQERSDPPAAAYGWR